MTSTVTSRSTELHFRACGVAFGTALGFSVGRADVPTVLFIGDAGLLMTLGELETVERPQPLRLRAAAARERTGKPQPTEQRPVRNAQPVESLSEAPWSRQAS